MKVTHPRYPEQTIEGFEVEPESEEDWRDDLSDDLSDEAGFDRSNTKEDDF